MKAVYEAPITDCFQVELEGSFCGSVDVSADNKTNGQIDNHDVNDNFTATFGDTYQGTSNWE